MREPRPATPHGTAVMLLGHHLTAFALEHGGIVTTETGFILQEVPPRVFGPDIAYLGKNPGKYGESGGWLRSAPDLAVEVISPSNRATHMQRKVDAYFEAGAAEVWVVYSDTRSVVLQRPDGSSRTLRGEDGVTSPVLPDFQLPVSEIFRF